MGDEICFDSGNVSSHVSTYDKRVAVNFGDDLSMEWMFGTDFETLT